MNIVKSRDGPAGVVGGAGVIGGTGVIKGTGVIRGTGVVSGACGWCGIGIGDGIDDEKADVNRG